MKYSFRNKLIIVMIYNYVFKNCLNIAAKGCFPLWRFSYARKTVNPSKLYIFLKYIDKLGTKPFKL